MGNRKSKRRLSGQASVLLSISLMGVLGTFSLPARAQSLNGFWQSEGYGLSVQIAEAKMSVSQITSISCLPWWTAERSDAGRNGEVVFNAGFSEIRVSKARQSDVLLMRQGASISAMSL